LFVKKSCNYHCLFIVPFVHYRPLLLRRGQRRHRRRGGLGRRGKVFDLSAGEWTRDATPTGQNLKAVVRGDVNVAVGAGGTIVEN